MARRGPTRQQLEAWATQAARKYRIPVGIFKALITHESGWDINALSPAGAVGPGQLLPATAQGMGLDPHNPRQNLMGAARYLRMQLDRFGKMPLALAAYNAGPGAVQKYGGIPPYAETQRYVRNILRDASKYGATTASNAPAARAAAALGGQMSAIAPDLASVGLAGISDLASGRHANPMRELSGLTSALRSAELQNAALAAAGGPRTSSTAPAVHVNTKGIALSGKSTANTDPTFMQHLLQAARAAGATRIRFASTTRPPAENAAVGGVAHSNHLPDSHGHSHAVDAEVYIPGRGWIPAGDIPSLSRFGLRSGDQPGFYRGGRDPSHVDDAFNQHH